MALAQPQFEYRLPCIDTLAVVQYPELLKHIPTTIAVSCFPSTFGTDCYPLARKELTGQRRLFKANLTWDDSHIYGAEKLREAKREAIRWQELCKVHPRKVQIAPFTEHNHHDLSFLDEIQALAPDCEVVNSILNGAWSKYYLNEIHGLKRPKKGYRYQYSADGTDVFKADNKKLYRIHKKALNYCTWYPACNLKKYAEEQISREQRIAEARFRKPTVEKIKALIRLAKGQG